MLFKPANGTLQRKYKWINYSNLSYSDEVETLYYCQTVCLIYKILIYLLMAIFLIALAM